MLCSLMTCATEFSLVSTMAALASTRILSVHRADLHRHIDRNVARHLQNDARLHVGLETGGRNSNL